MSLHSGRIINRLHATKLPMPAEVITRVDQLARTQNMLPSLAFGNRDNRLIMQDITDDSKTEDAYAPIDEADSTMYYDTEVSMIPDEEANTSSYNEETNNAPHRNIPTDMIQMNDSLTVSTVTDDAITQAETPTAAENNQLASLSEIDEEENQDEASQSLEHNMELTTDSSQDEHKHSDEQQNSIEQTPTDTNVGTPLDNEMNTKYGTRTTRWNLRQ